MARAAGLGEGFSGHSPRIGMAQDLTAAGVGLPALMVAGRWKSERMPAYYSRAQSAGRGAVANFYGNGGAPGGGRAVDGPLSLANYLAKFSSQVRD